MGKKLKFKIFRWAIVIAYFVLVFFDFPIPRDWGSLMPLFTDFDIWLINHDISPTSVGVFLVILTVLIIVPEAWRYYIEQVAPFDPKTADTDADNVIDYIVNDSRQLVEPSLKTFEDGQVVEKVGSEHIDAIRLLSEAAADGRVKVWGRRGVDPMSSAHRYEGQHRIIPQEYWGNAEIHWWNTLDPNGWPQTKPLHGDPDNDFVPYRSLRLNGRQVGRVWPSKRFRRLWGIITRRKRIVYPPENLADLNSPLPHTQPMDG